MARAKRTDRAEARRRYRAILQDQSGEGTEAEMEEEAEAPARQASSAGQSRARAAQGSDQVSQTKRVGFFGAFKAAYRPVHYREDLRFFVPLITRTNAIWPVFVMCMLGLGLVLVRRNPNDFLFQMVISMIITPLPMMPAMIAGFLAPRATWLAGLIAAFISSMTSVAWWVSGAMPVQAVVNGTVQVTGYRAMPLAELWPNTLQLLWIALPAGALLAALAGWYKRFLALTGPASQLARQQAAKNRAAKNQTAARKSTPPTSPR